MIANINIHWQLKIGRQFVTGIAGRAENPCDLSVAPKQFAILKYSE